MNKYRGQRVALVVPCYNEEAAIARVVTDFQAAMPEIDIIVELIGGYGVAKDLSLIARFDAGTKNTTFAPAPRKVRLGLSAAMPVTAGFWDVGVEVMKESNHNGIVGKDVKFSSAPVFTTAWAVAMGPGSFTGFLDIVGAKGKDGFGDETKAETLGRALYMFDIGGAKSGFKAGAGVEYWNNKFGCNNAKSFVKNSCTATTPVLLLEYHM